MGRTHVRGSSLLLLGRVVSLVFTVATQIIIVRALSKTDFGAFAYALALVTAGGAILSLGQGKLLSRFMSIYEEERDYGRMFGSMVLAAGTIMLTSTVLLLSLFLFSEALVSSTLGEPAAVQVLLILMFLAPMEALDQVFVSLFAVFSQPRSIFIRKYLLTPALRLAVVLLLVVVGAGVPFLALGYVLAQLVGLVVYGFLFVRVMRERGLLSHLRPRTFVLPFKAVFSFSFPSLTTEFVHLSMNTGSVILLGIYRGAAEIAGYRAVFPAARLNQFIFSSFVTLFLPMAARLFARQDRTGMRDAYWHTALFLAVFSFPVFALTTVFAPATTVALFGDRYADSATVLTLLSFGYYFNVALGFNAYTLSIYGRLRFLVAVNVTVALLNLGLSLLLVPDFGAVGVAVANCATLVVQNVLNQLALARTIGSAAFDREYIRPYLVIVLAVLALWGFQTVVQPGILVAIIVVSLVSLAVLLLTRRWLKLAETFPELTRLPVLGRVLR